jgi:hypothetical protein
MAMKFLAFDYQCVPDFASYNQNNNYVFLDIIQGAQVTYPKLKLSEPIRAQAFDRLRWCGGLVLKPGLDSRFDDSLLARGQAAKLPFTRPP